MELQVPSPIYIYVQLVALSSKTNQPTNQVVNTKRKVKIDQGTSEASFTDERISMIKPLQMNDQLNQCLSTIPIQFRLYAFHN